jgi:predicted nucleotidyltransferase
MRLPLIKKLNRAIWSNSPNYSLILVGSLASGLAIDDNSDLDLALIPLKTNRINDFWQMHGSRLRFYI